MIDSFNIEEKFYDAMDFFYQKNFHLAGQVSKLGKPKLVSSSIPTAGVYWAEEKNKIEFIFNSSFLKKLSDIEFYFAVAHEGMHILNGHIFSLFKEIKKMERQGTKSFEISRWKNKWNKAADCVINDSLVNLHGLPRLEWVGWHEDVIKKEISLQDLSKKIKVPVDHFIEFNSDLKEELILPIGYNLKIPGRPFYGKDLVGCDCHDLSVSDVMKLLPDDELSEVGNHDIWNSFFEPNGSLKQEFVDAVNEIIEENFDNSDFSLEDKQALEDLQQSMQGLKAGYSGKPDHIKKIKVKNSIIKWNRILFKKVPRGKFEEIWSSPSRKLTSFYPDLLMPTSRQKETEDIAVFMDVSASIDMEGTNLFASLVKNTPKNFKVKAFTFSTIVESFDLSSDDINIGGGTRFDIIENYIQENFKKYPKAVFVLTDGAGNSVYPQYPERWSWLLYGSAVQNYCKNMSFYKLKDIIS